MVGFLFLFFFQMEKRARQRGNEGSGRQIEVLRH